MEIYNRGSKKNFTSTELLIVITFVAIGLVVLVISLLKVKERGRRMEARAAVEYIYNAIVRLEMDTGKWPGHKTPSKKECNVNDNEICPDGCSYRLSDCRTGLICNSDPSYNYADWRGPYVVRSLKDPWENEYFFDTDYYTENECVVAIGSYGPNGVGLDQYDEDDVIYIVPSQ